MKNQVWLVVLSSLIATPFFSARALADTAPGAAPAEAVPAAPNSATANSAASDAAKTTPVNSAAAPLAGKVEHSVKDAQIAIRDLGDTSKHLKDAAWCTFCEVQQQDTVYVGGPNLIGGTTVIPAINGTGYINTGDFLPPRAKWLNYFVQNVDYLSRQLDIEIAATQLPDDASENARQSFARMNDIARGIPAKVMQLESVCKTLPYQNIPIAIAAQTVLDDLKEFEKMQKIVVRELKNQMRKQGKK